MYSSDGKTITLDGKPVAELAEGASAEELGNLSAQANSSDDYRVALTAIAIKAQAALDA